MNKEVYSSFDLVCDGVSSSGLAPLRNLPVDASVTVFKDGSREVGCTRLLDGRCQADTAERKRYCIHLYPEQNKKTFEKQNSLDIFTNVSSPFVPEITHYGAMRFRERVNQNGHYEIDTLGLPSRIRNALIRSGLIYIDELKFALENNLLNDVRNLGDKALAEIRNALFVTIDK